MKKQTQRICSALGLLIIWVFIVGSLTWQRSRESVIPPVWDQKSYVQKADAFWHSIQQGKIKNPLDIEPTVRPPGTILLTAPLGPLKDFRNFYFRSVMLPVAITILAVFITGVASTGQAWPSALVALLVGSMPMFWQFESQHLNTWGMVDGFLASFSALAMACLLAGSLQGKAYWYLPATVATALLPLIKPSGFIVAAMILLSWLAVSIRLLARHPRERKQEWITLAMQTCLFVVTLGTVGIISKDSAYFSADNIAFGNNALAQLREQWGGSLMTSLGYLYLIISHGIGLLPLTAIVFLIIIAAAQERSEKKSVITIMSAWTAQVGITVLLISLALCYQSTLFMQPRYLYPFITITIILIVPRLVVGSKQLKNTGLCCLALLPAGLIVCLSSPSVARMSKTWTGYELEAGRGAELIKLVSKLTQELHTAENQMPKIFIENSSINYSLMAFNAGYADNLQKMNYSDQEIDLGSKVSPSWDKDPVIEIQDIYNSDILVFSMDGGGSKTESWFQKSGYRTERNTWTNWLATTPASGSTVMSLRTPELMVLVVKNRELLEKQMRAFIASRSWRPEFLAANKIRNYSPGQLDSLNLSGELIKKPISYDNRLRVYALTISRAAPKAEKVVVTVYSERLPGGKKDTLSLFIHELDSSKNIVVMHEIPLSTSRLVGRPISMDETTFHAAPKTKKLAIGVYEPRIGAIRTDWSRSTDWDGRRATIGLDSLPPAQHSDR
jgi:hypothetical protein